MLLKNVYTGTISRQIRAEAYRKFGTGQRKSWFKMKQFHKMLLIHSKNLTKRNNLMKS